MINVIYWVVIVIAILALIDTVFYIIKKNKQTEPDLFFTQVIIVGLLIFTRLFTQDNKYFYFMAIIFFIFLAIRLINKEVIPIINVFVLMLSITCEMKHNKINFPIIVFYVMCFSMLIVDNIIFFIKYKKEKINVRRCHLMAVRQQILKLKGLKYEKDL